MKQNMVLYMWYMYKRKVIKNDYFTSFRKKENIILYKCF